MIVSISSGNDGGSRKGKNHLSHIWLDSLGLRWEFDHAAKWNPVRDRLRLFAEQILWCAPALATAFVGTTINAVVQPTALALSAICVPLIIPSSVSSSCAAEIAFASEYFGIRLCKTWTGLRLAAQTAS